MPAVASAALAAHQAGTLGVGISGGGFLISFILGALNMLYIELGILKHNMPVAGASTGALSTLFASGMVPMSKMRHTVEHVSSVCLPRGNCYGALEDVVKSEAKSLVPPNGFKYMKKHGKVYINVAFPDPDGKKPAELAQISNFTSEDDMLGALYASTYIPTWSGASMATTFRGRPAYDGSMVGPPESFLPCPPGVGYCVRISSMPAGDTIPEGFFNYFLFGQPSDQILAFQTLFDTLGGSDLGARLQTMADNFHGKGPEGTAKDAAQWLQWFASLMTIRTPGKTGADIWPGRRHPLPSSLLQWYIWMLSPPKAETRQIMYELGRKEALSWAIENGFVPANTKVSEPEKRSPYSMDPRRVLRRVLNL